MENMTAEFVSKIMEDLTRATGKNNLLGKQVCDQEQRIKELEQQNAELVAKLAEYSKYHTTLANIQADAIEEVLNTAILRHEQKNKDLMYLGESSKAKPLKVVDLKFIEVYANQLREQAK